MVLTLTGEERAVLSAALKQARGVRQWRRLQALLLLSSGQSPVAVAQAVGSSRSSVYNWVQAWQTAGVTGLQEGPHRGRARRLDAAGDALLESRLRAAPQDHGYHATGWTVPLLLTELSKAGYTVSEQTVRRTWKRLKWRWKRPKYVLGRPDPAYAEKKGL